MNQPPNNEFRYTYSAREQAELRRIREKYAPEKEDKMARLRRLDRSVSRVADLVALCLGIAGTLILGLGMSLIMTELGQPLGQLALPIGVAIGIAGGVIAALAYPLHARIVRARRQKLAPEILRLTEELMK